MRNPFYIHYLLSSFYILSLRCYFFFKIIRHGATTGVRNFWHLSTKILYTVEPKTATSPCVHFEVAASPTKKNTSLLYVSIFSRFEIVEIIGSNTREIISSASFAWTTDNFQALLKGIFSWVCFLPFAGKHRSWTVCNPFYIHRWISFYLSFIKPTSQIGYKWFYKIV